MELRQLSEPGGAVDGGAVDGGELGSGSAAEHAQRGGRGGAEHREPGAAGGGARVSGWARLLGFGRLRSHVKSARNCALMFSITHILYCVYCSHAPLALWLQPLHGISTAHMHRYVLGARRARWTVVGASPVGVYR